MTTQIERQQHKPPRSGWFLGYDENEWELYLEYEWMGYIETADLASYYWVERMNHRGQFVRIVPDPTTMEEAKAVVLALARLGVGDAKED